MKIFFNKKKLIQILKEQNNLGFVPTMGAIHKAHIYILKKSISLCKKTIVTIFINKPQFNKINDYKKYPRNLKKDISILRKYKVDYLYLPSTKQIYPSGSNKKIKINSLIPAFIPSSKIYSNPGLPFIGKSSFGNTLVRGNNLVPNPAKGIIACLIICIFYI